MAQARVFRKFQINTNDVSLNIAHDEATSRTHIVTTNQPPSQKSNSPAREIFADTNLTQTLVCALARISAAERMTNT